ncbi:MAG TPA: hypothetical protein PKA10_13710 [Selenomonadales bacterium]|nr:hypothetical protein [Selenomonadales bacterium]
MKRRLIPRLAGVLLWLLLTGNGILGGLQPERAVPGGEPPLSIRRAQAAPFWDAWLRSPATPLAFNELYSGASSLGLELSPKLKSLEGKRVVMTGFMAPPLKPTLAFFVLTQTPMAICPFCSSDADWPSNIILVKLSQPVDSLPFDQPIAVTGMLELGTQVDSETGFVSLVRIQADTVERAD